MSSTPQHISIRDLAFFGLALLPSVLVAIFFYDFTLPPFEDAAMLMRYADHLAAGEGIVWNPGEPPVDGATDFLFMVMVAGLHKTGLSLELSVRLLSSLAHLLTLWYVFRINLRDHGAGLPMSLASVAYLSLGPGLMYLESYFGTPVFALAGLLCYRHFLRMLKGELQSGDVRGFAIWGLLAGLIRPEGVLLAGAMFLTLLAARSGKEFFRIARTFVLVFGIAGGAYFAWHWWYFGHPLPNPFYVKGGGLLYLGSMRASILFTLLMGLPLFPLFLYATWKQRMRRRVILHMAPVVGFALVWVLMSNAMNYGMRFQYVLLPMMMVAWTPVLGDLLKGYPRTRWLPIAGGVLVVASLGYQFIRYHDEPRMFPDGRVDIARALAPYADKGYSMAVTEAGNLPFFSGWHAIDTWGLNDSQIAHAGIVSAEYLDQFKPVLIMVHDYWAPGHKKLIHEPRWAAMTEVLEEYAGSRGYEMVACFGAEPQNTHFYYLRRDFPDYARIRDIILKRPYVWYEDGRPAVNFVK